MFLTYMRIWTMISLSCAGRFLPQTVPKKLPALGIESLRIVHEISTTFFQAHGHHEKRSLGPFLDLLMLRFGAVQKYVIVGAFGSGKEQAPLFQF
jgi:hypothetical protein